MAPYCSGGWLCSCAGRGEGGGGVPPPSRTGAGGGGGAPPTESSSMSEELAESNKVDSSTSPAYGRWLLVDAYGP